MADKKKTASVVATEEEMSMLDKVVNSVKAAQRKYATYTQEQVDKIFRAAAIAAAQNRIPLAKMAVAERSAGITNVLPSFSTTTPSSVNSTTFVLV